MTIYIWGTGDSAKYFFHLLNNNVVVKAFIERFNNNTKSLFQVDVIGVDEIQDFDYIVICSYAYDFILPLLMKKYPYEKLIVGAPGYYTVDEVEKINNYGLFSERGKTEFKEAVIERQNRIENLIHGNRKEISVNYWKARNIPFNYDNPITLNDKIKRMEIDKYGKLETYCTDRYRVRNYIKYCGLDDILLKIYNVWTRPEDIDFENLPAKCVLKCNNGCGDSIIMNDNKILKEYALDFITRHYRDTYGILGMEWHYYGIEPLVYCEEYLEGNTARLVDYKYFCCNGEIASILVCTDRNDNGESRHAYYDENWNELMYATDDVYANKSIPKPHNLDKLNHVARILSRVFPFVRVDLYSVGDKVYFGELTFSPVGGNITIQTDEAQIIMGGMIDMDYKKDEREKIYNIISEIKDV